MPTKKRNAEAYTAPWLAPEPTADWQPGIHVLIVSVSTYLCSRYATLRSVERSADTLTVFWKNVAAGSEKFASGHPVSRIAARRCHKGPRDLAGTILHELQRWMSDINDQDILVVHWLGHGAVAEDGKQYLILPNLFDPTSSSTPEAFQVDRLLLWFAQNCRASNQLFFLDCCGAEDSSLKPSERFLPAHQPKVPAKNVEQRAFIGSGARRHTLGGASHSDTLFTTGFLRACRSLATGPAGAVVINDLTSAALAATIKREWLAANEQGFPPAIEMSTRGYPKGKARPHEWVKRFVRDMEIDESLCVGGRLKCESLALGQAGAPETHLFVGIQLRPDPPQPMLALAGIAVPLAVYHYTGSLQDGDRFHYYIGVIREPDVIASRHLPLAVAHNGITRQESLGPSRPVSYVWID